jgi:hypothetical protein
MNTPETKSGGSLEPVGSAIMGLLILWLLKEALSRLFRMLIPADQIAVVGTGVLDKLSDLIRIMPCEPDDALDNTFVLPHSVVPIRVECQEQREHVRLVATKKPALNLRNDLSWQLHGCAHVAEQYVWPEVSRRTGRSSGFGDLMGEL